MVDGSTLEGKPLPSSGDLLGIGGMGYAALIDRAGRVRWTTRWAAETPGDWDRWIMIDLDGDGRDELVLDDEHKGHFDDESRELVVYVLAHGVPTISRHAEPLPLGYTPDRGDHQNTCSATYRFAAHR